MDYWNGNIPWATVKDLISDWSTNTQEHITKKGLTNSSANIIPKGTLIIATRMGLGKVIRFSQDVAINQDLKALFPNSNLDKNFLFQWLKYKASLIEGLGSGSTVKGIRLEVLKAIKILLPPLPEQKQIASILSSVDESIQKAKDKKSQLEKVKKGLMQDLLSGKVRVKVEVYDWWS
jgi:type I restriction enzyme S subunit